MDPPSGSRGGARFELGMGLGVAGGPGASIGGAGGMGRALGSSGVTMNDPVVVGDVMVGGGCGVAPGTGGGSVIRNEPVCPVRFGPGAFFLRAR